MIPPELAEEVLDDLEVMRARDPRGLLPAVAGAGAQVRETARLTEEAGLARVTGGGRPRGLVVIARREGAVAASVSTSCHRGSSPRRGEALPASTSSAHCSAWPAGGSPRTARVRTSSVRAPIVRALNLVCCAMTLPRCRRW